MPGTILKLDNVMKTYIIGRHRTALKVQQAIQRRQAGHSGTDDRLLREAQDLFTQEHYAEAYVLITGKTLRPQHRDRGTVVHALRGVNLEIAAGDLVAIMGPSGSGKSTLLNMLGLLDQPTAGCIFIAGRDLTAIKRSELPAIRSHQLGFVFQAFNLIETLTALENVMLPLRYAGIHPSRRHALAAEALERVGLADRLGHSPGELSGGQQQRVAIARSIVTHPQLILADELTGELDSAMTLEIMHLILDLNHGGQTFIIVTHNPEVARLCRRVIHMRDGRIEHEEQASARHIQAVERYMHSGHPSPALAA